VLYLRNLLYLLLGAVPTAWFCTNCMVPWLEAAELGKPVPVPGLEGFLDIVLLLEEPVQPGAGLRFPPRHLGQPELPDEDPGPEP
jgi:hypothetical protein